MEYVYPAIFKLNEDGSYTITYPDLPGCISEGKSLASALYMAQDALAQWLEYLSEKKQTIPKASLAEKIELSADEFINFVRVEAKDERAVRRTVSIPKWMDDQVSERNLSLSRVLQDALQEKLSV